MIAIDLESPASPSGVLAAMRTHAGEWRETRMPAELKAAGISATEGWVDGMTFILIYAPSANWGRQWAPYLRARATVSQAGAGSRIHDVVDYDMRDVVMPMIGGGFATLIAVVAFGRSGLLVLLGPVSLWGIAYASHRFASRNISRAGSPAADYLVRRIEAAVAGARRTSAQAPAS